MKKIIIGIIGTEVIKIKRVLIHNYLRPYYYYVILILTFNFSFLSSNFLYADFEIVDGGARALGLSKAFTAIADNSSAVFYNPAGLLQIENSRLDCGYRKLFWGLDDESNLADGFLTYVQPLGKISSLGFGLYNFSLANYYSENVWALSYAYDLSNYVKKHLRYPFFVGLTIKMLSKKYEKDPYTMSDYLFKEKGYSKNGYAVDFGALYKLKQNYCFGITLLNLNQPNMDLKDKTSELPIVYKIGVAYRINSFNLDTELVIKRRDINSYTGVEKWLFNKIFGIRGGLGIGSREYRSISLGFSYKNPVCQIDYAFVYPLTGITETAGSHSMSLSLPFRIVMKEKEKPAPSVKEPVQIVPVQEITTPPPEKVPPPEKITVPEKITRYVVKEGDTLPSVSAKPEIYGDPLNWRKIYEANKDKIGIGYNLPVGLELVIPRD